MASTARIDELKKKFDENPRRYFAPLANEFRKAGDIEQAIVICEEFLPQQPGHMSGHIVYGQALFEASRLPESRTVFETALALDPENLIALRHLGDIAHSQGDDGAARGWYLRVLDADPRNEEIQSLIAQLAPDETAVEKEAPEPSESESAFAHLMDEPSAPVSNEPVRLEYVEPEAIAPEPVEPEPIEPPKAARTSSYADTQPTGIPAIPWNVTPPAVEAQEPALLDLPIDGQPNVMGDTEAEQHAAPVSESHEFVAGEFTPLNEGVEVMDGLESHHETPTTAFRAPVEPIAQLDGLEGSGGVSHEELADARASSSVASVEAQEEFAPLDFETVGSGTPEAPVEAISEVPAELPPAVIAAEAALTPDEPDVQDEYEEYPPAVAPAAPFVTETMAELYLAQGFRAEALSVYQQLSSANPSDERLSGIVAELEAGSSLRSERKEAAAEGPSARDFLSRLASRRPGEARAAAEPPSDDDFAPPQFSEPEPEPEAEPTPPAEPELSEASEGSIDALFGHQAPSRSEDSAAHALAQAFGGTPEEVPVLAGRPARAASGELTLDSVFRDAPQRAQRVSQNFSFDQFFAGGSTSAERPSGSSRVIPETPAAGTTAEKGADDIAQFNSWLQGLKPR